MTTTYNNLLRLTEIGNGEQSGTWGATTNNNLGTLLCDAIAGAEAVNIGSATSYLLTSYDGVADQSRNAVLEVSGSPASTVTITCPNSSKVYIVKNSTSQTLTFTRSSGGDTVSVPAGATSLIYCNGSGFYAGLNNLPASSTVNGVSIVTTSGSQTLTNKTISGGTITGITDLAIADGGTGASTAADARSNLAVAGTGVSNTFTANQIVEVTDNTNAALRVTQLGTGNAILVEDSTNPDATPFAVDSSGRIIAGYTSSVTATGATAGLLQVNGIAGYQQLGWDASTHPYTTIGRSRSGTVGTHEIVQSGDLVGAFKFAGSDGTNFINAASISAIVDGVPGTNDMPGALLFSTTADGAASVTERFRIGSAGQLGIGGANYGTSGQVLISGGAAAAPSWGSAGGGAPDVIVEDRKTSGTAGGSGTAAAWTTRTLNTLYRNNGSIATLSSNQITLPVGTYYITARSPFYYVGNGSDVSYYRIRLYNVTDSAEERLGYNAAALTGSSPDRPNQIDANLEAVLTVTGSSKTFRIEYYVGQFRNVNANNLGVPSSLGTEIYTSMNIWKIG